MSRLSDILGVKEGQEFRFKGKFYRITGDVREVYENKWFIACSEKSLCDMIANPELIKIIPEKQTLTEQQITAIKGRIAEGTPWVARDKDSNNVWFYEKEPHSQEGYFGSFGNSYSTNNPIYNFITFENSPIYLPDLIKG